MKTWNSWKDTPNCHKYRANPEALVKYTKRKIELNLGQVLLFHSGLAHRSGKNISNRPRFSLVSVYHQVENSLIRPIAYSGSFKGVEVEEYFREFCGETRLPDDENHFSWYFCCLGIMVFLH